MIHDESAFFDALIDEQGEFDPFTERGWRKLSGAFVQLVDPRHAMSVLDVGCGTGASARIYADVAAPYVGIDLSIRALSVARRRLGPAAPLLLADACRMPFAPESFDLVAFSSVLHHIGDFRVPLVEAMRILKPGGHVFAFDPNALHPAMGLLRQPASPFYIAGGVSPNERPLHPAALRRAFAAAGLTGIRQRAVAGVQFRSVAPSLIDRLLPIYDVFDRLMEISGTGRWFGPFVVTTGRAPG
ncbi:MAG TPA: class I SAM-dependent methyltransferase [Thermoanaerobaculia bacterium]|nr:class I SAM-dependent methyltransferase [Thermoanaerobaculia bacterium]